MEDSQTNCIVMSSSSSGVGNMGLLSYDNMPQETTLPSRLKTLSEEIPDREAFVFIDNDWKRITLTWREIWDKSRKYAAILRRHGIRKGDIVCNTLVNSPERLLTTYGTMISGGTPMHGQVLLTDGEDLIHNLRVAKSKAIIVDPSQTKGALAILKRIQITGNKTGEIRFKGLPCLATVIYMRVCCPADDADGTESYRRDLYRLDEEHEMYDGSEISENDVATIFSTSGTTGFSKQVPQTHRSCLLNVTMFGESLGLSLSKRSRVYMDTSLGWIGGFPAIGLVYGTTRILSDHAKRITENADVRLLRILNEESVDTGLLLPGEIDVLVKSIKSGHGLNKILSTVTTGGMPINKRIVESLGVVTDSINVMYGSTEAGFLTYCNIKKNDPFEDYCVGFPVPGALLKIVDKDHNEVPDGQVGEVAVRHTTVTAGYLNEPDKTEKAHTKDGYFLMGDTAYKDEKGRFYVYGRESDAIHCGLYIHYPGFIESRIQRMPGIEKVCVIGVPSELNHHDICACIIPSDKNLTRQQVLDHCTDVLGVPEDIRMSAVPKHFLFFDSFPRNNNGKLDKKELKAEACARLGI